jgi:hypothetical protein
MAFPPRKSSGSKDDLDRPWVVGDAIPAPEAVVKDGDSAWALFDELSKQHERKFADTEHVSAPGSLPSEDHGWAPTRPAGSEQRPSAQARRDKQPLFTLEAAMLVARRNNRVCPRPERWAAFVELLPPRKTVRGLQAAPAAPLGAAWPVTPPLTKRLCFREQIEWAEKQGVLENAIAFMQAMPEADWLHMGED